MKKIKFFKIVLPAFGVVLLLLGVYYVIAQTVTDTFDNDNKIADTWHISTSTSGEIKLASKTCDSLNWYCNASTTCANYAGDGDYIIVAQADASTTKQWKTTATPCDRPECGADGGQNGDNLVNDNTVDFISYPARDYCKSIGARLPTRDELECMYNNRATFGDNFAAGNYWSATEYSDTYARNVNFSSGNSHNNDKTFTYYVRCVFGW